MRSNRITSKVEHLDESKQFDVDETIQFIKENPALVSPILEIRNNIELNSFSPAMWKQYKANRSSIPSETLFETYAEINEELFYLSPSPRCSCH